MEEKWKQKNWIKNLYELIFDTKFVGSVLKSINYIFCAYTQSFVYKNA